MRVTSNGQTSDPVAATLAPISPAFFTFDGNTWLPHMPTVLCLGKPGLFSDSPALTTPATPGETIVLYGTGFGATTPARDVTQLATAIANIATPFTIAIVEACRPRFPSPESCRHMRSSTSSTCKSRRASPGRPPRCRPDERHLFSIHRRLLLPHRAVTKDEPPCESFSRCSSVHGHAIGSCRDAHESTQQSCTHDRGADRSPASHPNDAQKLLRQLPFERDALALVFLRRATLLMLTATSIRRARR